MIVNLFNRVFITDQNINILPSFNYCYLCDIYHMNLSKPDNVYNSINELYDYTKKIINNNSYNFVICTDKQFFKLLSNYFIYLGLDNNDIEKVLSAYNKQYTRYKYIFKRLNLIKYIFPENSSEDNLLTDLNVKKYKDRNSFLLPQIKEPNFIKIEMAKDFPLEMVYHFNLDENEKHILYNKIYYFISYDILDILQKINLYNYNSDKEILYIDSIKPYDKYFADILKDINSEESYSILNNFILYLDKFVSTNLDKIQNSGYKDYYNKIMVVLNYLKRFINNRNNIEEILNYYMKFVATDRGYVGFNKFKYNKYLEKEEISPYIYIEK